MTVELWIGQKFDTSHERRALDRFLTGMQAKFGQSVRLYLVLANYYVGGRQLDLTVLKRDAVIVIELKECAGPFRATENGAWLTIPDKVVIGTGNQNPFEQARDYRFRLINRLTGRRDNFLPPAKARSMNLYHVSAFVAISPSLHPQHENRLSPLPWFRLVGLDDLSDAVEQQTSRELNFSNQELRKLAADVLTLKPVRSATDREVAPEDLLPTQVGRYRISALLGRGGMGTVYRAHDPDLSREVVIKFISPTTQTANARWRERFRREVQAASRFNHPYIVTIYDVDLDHQTPYVVMELLAGGSLEERLRDKTLSWQEALALLRLLAEALGYAHQAGVIHRDVKPGNIMFAGEAINSVKLVDFGLARRQDAEALTQAGVAIGTPAYMSPEQALGETVDHRTDIFALGIILFEAIMGFNPLAKGSSISTLLEASSEVQIDLSPLDDQVPPEVVKVIARATTKDRNQRYQTCEELVADLDYCLGELGIATTTHFTPISKVSQPANNPDIRVAANIDLTTEVETVLGAMFSTYEQIAIETEFRRGFSGSRVFRVRLVELGGRSHLPAVVKIAPIGLIHKEWQAYQTWVEHTLPNTARLQLAPVFPPGSLWGGLRYSLVGEGTFTIQSLSDYYQEADIDEICWVLENRLFKIIGTNWWLDNRATRTFQMQTDYDALLPVNLLIKALSSASDAAHPDDRSSHQDGVHLIEAGKNLVPPEIALGDQVQLKGFVITKVDPQGGQVTLNLQPAAAGKLSPSFQVRLDDVANIARYQVGNTIDSLQGLVVATRHSYLSDQVKQVLGGGVDLAAKQLALGGGLRLPNPVLAYQALLNEFLTVNISTIHGDLNLENILIDMETREVSLIDFATVHQGHALRDLLRLEMEVVIGLIPPALAEAKLPPQTIYHLYQQLHQVTLYPSLFDRSNLPHAALEKPFKMLWVIRKMARSCLFNIDDWGEYYRGLTLYLLSTLKFASLHLAAAAPLPRQTAFWGAATALLFLKAPPARQPQRPEDRPLTPTVAAAPSSEIDPPYGTMHPNSIFYIERTADEDCWRAINSRQAVTLFIQAPRQMGKSSLMRRVIEQAKTKLHQPSAFIDFQKFPADYFSREEDFLIEFCLMMSDTLEIPEAIDQYWGGRRTNNYKCSRYLSNYIIPQINRPFILAMDEVERMLTSPFQANFFGMLRSWHNDRAFNENFAKMTLFLSSSTEPYLFIDNPNQSPFNVAQVISLPDFSKEKVEELNQRHHSPLSQSQVNDLLDLVGGHPLLIRVALYQLATKKVDMETLLARATEDTGPFGDHLRHYLLRVLQQPELKQALISISRNHRYEENQVFHRLKGAGLIKRVGQDVVLRNRLYAQYFEERLNG